MRILQLVSDWKWTGPAEPMLVLMQGLRTRGHQVDLVCPQTPRLANRSLWQEASVRELDPIASIAARRGAWRPGDGRQVRRLARWIETPALAGPYDVVHTWHSRDHVLTARALRLGWLGSGRESRPRLVRSLSHGERISPWAWNRWLFGPACDGLVCVSDGAVAANRELRQGRVIAATSGAIDFSELTTKQSPEQIRASLGVPADAPLIGVVARMQRHRRFDLLLAAFQKLLVRCPEARLVLIGRGTRQQEVVVSPAESMGLSDRVIRAGYRVEDYADVLSAMDLCTYLVPGSDGTCRALLQAAALGIPMVGSRRGAIPEIISNGQTGLLVNEEPDALAAAWASLIEQPTRRREMGEEAARDALLRFQPDRLAAWMERFYRELVGAGGDSSPHSGS